MITIKGILFKVNYNIFFIFRYQGSQHFDKKVSVNKNNITNHVSRTKHSIPKPESPRPGKESLRKMAVSPLRLLNK